MDYTVNVFGEAKVRDLYHITGKYRGFGQRDCNINGKLNHKMSIVYHNLKNYDSYLIIKYLGKFDSKTNVLPNGLEKYMSLISIIS